MGLVPWQPWEAGFDSHCRVQPGPRSKLDAWALEREKTTTGLRLRLSRASFLALQLKMAFNITVVCAPSSSLQTITVLAFG